MYMPSRTIGTRFFDALLYAMLVLLAFLFVYPFWTLLLASFSDALELQHIGLKFWNKTWTLEPYMWVFTDRSLVIGIGYLNTIFRTVVGTTITLLVTLCAGYSLSKRYLPGRTYIMFFFVFTMFFGGGLIPTYLLVLRLGFLDSRWVYVIPTAANAFYVIIARNFLMALDPGMEESALMDGATRTTVLFRIVAPLSKPMMAIIGLWTAVSHWNSWFDSLIYIKSPNKRVLQLILHRMRNLLENYREFEMYNLQLPVVLPPESVQAVIVLITIGPIVLAYPFAQRYFVRGIMLGAFR
jgi:putative aldouronate transport system permease protein